MQKILQWFQKEHYLPYDNYTWSRLLSEPKKKFLISAGCLKFADTTVNEIRMDSEDLRVEKIGNQWYALNEETELKLSSKDPLKLELNKRTFVSHISKALDIQNPLSDLSCGCDGFFLGNLNVGNGYRVFFYFSSYKFVESATEVLGDAIPLVIAFDEISDEAQSFVARKNGVVLKLEDCVKLTNSGFEIIGSLKELLGNPRKQKPKDGYYCWSATGHPVPENASLRLLKIDFLSAEEISVTYGGKPVKFRIEDVSIFRNDITKEANDNWYMMFACARKVPYRKRDLKSESLKTYVKRLNKDFRDFFKFKGTAFSLENRLLIPNFELYANYITSTKSYSQIFKE